MNNIKTNINIGLVAIARSTFDMALAGQLFEHVRSNLLKAGFSVSSPDTLIGDVNEAAETSRRLAGDPLDLLILLQATFADSTIAAHLAQDVDAPILLWALPEPVSGGRLRLNSLCGINLAAHAFRRACIDYDYVYADPDDVDSLQRVAALAGTGRVRRHLRGARIGRVGENPDGFDSCRFDATALASLLGVVIVQISLERVFQLAREADAKSVDALHKHLQGRLTGLEELDQAAVRRTLSSYLALRQIVDEDRLAGLGVQCWPQFFTELECAACGAMSMLSDELTPCSCEADINGTITQLILQILSGQPAFGSDLVAADTDANTAVLWHCGLAPLSMADTGVPAKGTIHSNRKLPLLMEFPLKPGKITIARLSEAGGDFRLVVGNAEILQAPISFSGTSGIVHFDRPITDILDTIMKEGLEHHFSITYGNYTSALHSLAKQLGLEVVDLS